MVIYTLYADSKPKICFKLLIFLLTYNSTLSLLSLSVSLPPSLPPSLPSPRFFLVGATLVLVATVLYSQPTPAKESDGSVLPVVNHKVPKGS